MGSSIGQRIAQAIAYRGRTANQVLDELQDREVKGSARSTFYRYLKGEGGEPRIELIHAVADILAVDPNWIALGPPHEMTHSARAIDKFASETTERATAESDPFGSNPLIGLFPEDVQPLFISFWKRYVEGVPGELSDNAIWILGQHLAVSLLAPLEVWGFNHDLREQPRAFSEYIATMLVAWSKALPAPGQGDEQRFRGSLYGHTLQAAGIDEEARERLLEQLTEERGRLTEARDDMAERFKRQVAVEEERFRRLRPGDDFDEFLLGAEARLRKARPNPPDR